MLRGYIKRPPHGIPAHDDRSPGNTLSEACAIACRLLQLPCYQCSMGFKNVSQRFTIFLRDFINLQLSP